MSDDEDTAEMTEAEARPYSAREQETADAIGRDERVLAERLEDRRLIIKRILERSPTEAAELRQIDSIIYTLRKQIDISTEKLQNAYEARTNSVFLGSAAWRAPKENTLGLHGALRVYK